MLQVGGYAADNPRILSQGGAYVTELIFETIMIHCVEWYIISMICLCFPSYDIFPYGFLFIFLGVIFYHSFPILFSLGHY